jgi:hypothetical protein
MQLKIKDNMLIISMDFVDYAYIEDVTNFDEIDIDKVTNWVNETCYNNDHLCDAYIPPYLKFSEFKLEGDDCETTK